MMKLISAGILISAVALGGCAREAGDFPFDERFGEAYQANFAAQDAYNFSNQRLKDLGRDFMANTTDTVTFAFDKANIDSQARAALDTQVAWLKEHPEVRMTIIGHTDLVGSERYNKGLGLRRARAVLHYLARRGISRGRLEAIASRGETEPVVPTEQRERRNRRTVTTVAGFARNYVGTGLDGEYAARVYDTYQSGNIGPEVGGIN
jgi:outer membrane protein OmpA-like peptidoglycan-associated protein